MIHENYRTINRVLATLVFFISFLVYFDTMAPSVSYWDCGEFIAVSYTLGVPHPPGSPLFLLLGRIASILPISEDIAFRVNILSPIVSAFAVFFLYLIIVQVILHWRGKLSSQRDALVAFGSGVVGSLTFAFTDSHWFNAVEAEVYAFSTFFTAIVVWLILVWSEKADQRGHEKYILIIAYMIGLATGLHLLNLLTLPFVALVIYFRKYNFSWKSFGVTMLITAIVFFYHPQRHNKRHAEDSSFDRCFFNNSSCSFYILMHGMGYKKSEEDCLSMFDLSCFSSNWIFYICANIYQI